jgi:protein-disulfide isomerase
LKPVVEDGRVIFGPKDAKITVIEYSDFQCPYCSKGHATVDETAELREEGIEVVSLPVFPALKDTLQ